jgi:CspA family cold shock protein
MIGVVKWFNPQKGFGFIEPDNGGNDVFVHASEAHKSGLRDLCEGVRVRFRVEKDPNNGKPHAVDMGTA